VDVDKARNDGAGATIIIYSSQSQVKSMSCQESRDANENVRNFTPERGGLIVF